MIFNTLAKDSRLALFSLMPEPDKRAASLTDIAIDVYQVFKRKG